MWHLQLLFTDGLGSAWLMVGCGALIHHFQPKQFYGTDTEQQHPQIILSSLVSS